MCSITPTTIEGIKRLAKQIKADEGIKHSQALDAAARAAGFQNFAEARGKIEAKP